MTTQIHTVTDLFATSTSRWAAQRAVIDDRGELTYAELARWADRAAAVLAAQGVRQGDRVAVAISNCREYLFVWFGAAKLGAILVAVNTRLRGEALMHQLTFTEPSCILMEDELFATLSDEERARFRKIPVFLHDPGSGAGELGDLLREAGESPLQEAATVREGDPHVIMYTSGTTGRPKAAVIPHYAYVQAAFELAEIMEMTEADCTYVCLPLYHGNPQVMSVMPTLARGGSLAIARGFSASRFWDDVARFGATVFTHIGGVIEVLLKREPSESDPDNSLRLAFGGAPATAVAEFAERFQCRMLDGWGMIEIGCNTTASYADGLLGQHGLARRAFEVAVVDDADHHLSVGEVGEIVVRPRSPHVMFTGYYGEPDRTLERLLNLWFHTGDHGRLYSDGSLQYLGRQGDGIRRSGENLPTETIEFEIARFPGVAEVAVVGTPAPIVGQELVACVVPVDGAQLSPEQIVSFVDERLGKTMAPRFVRICGALPRTASEKVQRYKLREMGVIDAWDREANPVES